MMAGDINTLPKWLNCCREISSFKQFRSEPLVREAYAIKKPFYGENLMSK